MRRACFGVLSVGLLIFFTACNSRPSATVSGKVTYKGQLVKAGDIHFVYNEGQCQTAIRDDGTYSFFDIPTGEAKVYIWNAAFDPEQKPPSYGAAGKNYGSSKMSDRYGEYNKQVGGGEKAGEVVHEPGKGLSPGEKEKLAKVYVKLPVKYTSAKTTDLVFTISNGTQTKDFELKD